jgi:hypothetical protein
MESPLNFERGHVHFLARDARRIDRAGQAGQDRSGRTGRAGQEAQDRTPEKTKKALHKKMKEHGSALYKASSIK